MTKAEQALLAEAEAIYEKIYPCGTKQSLKECFTLHDNMVLFWFNTSDSSTHLLMGAQMARQRQ
ncbi:MAG: hypothetical protein ACOC4C_02450 [Fibrobacterota bacterium]